MNLEKTLKNKTINFFEIKKKESKVYANSELILLKNNSKELIIRANTPILISNYLYAQTTPKYDYFNNADFSFQEEFKQDPNYLNDLVEAVEIKKTREKVWGLNNLLNYKERLKECSDLITKKRIILDPSIRHKNIEKNYQEIYVLRN